MNGGELKVTLAGLNGRQVVTVVERNGWWAGNEGQAGRGAALLLPSGFCGWLWRTHTSPLYSPSPYSPLNILPSPHTHPQVQLIPKCICLCMQAGLAAAAFLGGWEKGAGS